ncbi:MAG: AAA family ATPase [Lachnospiraceae bacterium]|nr:AAA family ATPase [Lachnospiraceae bacterium]
MEIRKIVITGGPCAGKTTALSWIQNAMTQLGYRVLFVPETATELITGGVAPWTCGTNAEYQKCQMRMQMEKERIFEQAAKTMDAEKILIVCDRGELDNRAYMNDAEFQEVLEYLGTGEIELRDAYDAVFHLVTAAKGAEEFYTTLNNAARYETYEEARALDDRLIAAWTGHPHLRVIDNSSDFEDKMKRLIAEITFFLGAPDPFENEHRFLIEYPDIQRLASLPGCQRLEILQTFVKAESGTEIRLRRRGSDGHYTYYQTVRKKSGAGTIELERKLFGDEYRGLLMNADPERHVIKKDRYYLIYRSQYFKIDVYPFWTDRAIAEIELTEPGQEIIFPEEIRVIREITNEEAYQNASLAKEIPV